MDEQYVITISCWAQTKIHRPYLSHEYQRLYIDFLIEELLFSYITILCLLTLQMLHTKFGKDWPSSSREDVNAWQLKMLMHDRQCTTTDVNGAQSKQKNKKTRNPFGWTEQWQTTGNQKNSLTVIRLKVSLNTYKQTDDGWWEKAHWVRWNSIKLSGDLTETFPYLLLYSF